MNRREFLKLAGVGAAVLALPIPTLVNRYIPPDPATAFPSGTYAAFDKFLSTNVVQPAAVWGDPLVIDEAVEIYEASRYA